MERSGGCGEREPGAGRGVAALPAMSCLADSSFVLGKQKKSKKRLLEEKKWQSLEEPGNVDTQQRRHLALARSKTYDPSFCKESEKGAAAGRQGGSSSSVSPPGRTGSSGARGVKKGPRPPCEGGTSSTRSPSDDLPRAGYTVGSGVPWLSKRAASFRKVFQEIADKEALLDCFSCAWQKEVPYHGHLYISSSYVCFHSSLLLKDIKAVVPVPSITALKKTNTVLLVPNALSIRTAEGEKFLFVSLRRREATYQLLKSVCRHLQDNGLNGDPLASPLDGSTEQTLRKTLTSSQCDPERSSLELSSVLEQPDGLRLKPRRAEEDEDAPALGRGGPRAALQPQTTAKAGLAQTRPLRAVIVIYLLLMVALLLSSGYIGLRIVELERQLMAMAARPDLSAQHPYKKT